MQSSQQDDEIYRTIQIYSPQFSCNIDILVGLVFLENDFLSVHCLKGQQQSVTESKVLQRQP